MTVIDDYGHHPTAIARTLEAVRGRYPGQARVGRLRAAHLPPDGEHARRFAQVLARADEVAIADIWAGRDPDTTITQRSALADAVRAAGGPTAVGAGDRGGHCRLPGRAVKAGDVVLVMGGGRSMSSRSASCSLRLRNRGEPAE